ncbi:MAG: hypothetical protein M3O07_09720 [Pseudomonadota bacterium]|nr:hypothetical protein [Pseudomonadota bacterium]
MIHDACVRYGINDRDEITYVNAAWDQFAEANEGTDVAGDRIHGRILWDFISDKVTRQLYQQIVARVRQGSEAKFTLRCDSPSCRRHLEMTIRARETNVVEFATRSLRLEERAPVDLLTRAAPRSTDLLLACAWCNRINVGSDAWAEVEIAAQRLKLFEAGRMPQLTHGICAACFGRMTDSLDDLKAGA